MLAPRAYTRSVETLPKLPVSVRTISPPSVSLFVQWPLTNDSHPFIRLDFILLSHTILGGGLKPGNGQSGTISEPPHDSTNNTQRGGSSVAHKSVGLKAGVDRSNVTEVLSDHFPVYASWEDSDRPEIELF
jgi:hypothetical protein